MKKTIKVTKEDLILNEGALEESGIKEGDEIVLPAVSNKKAEVIDTLEKAFKKYGLEYQESYNLIDLAKQLGVYFQDGYTLDQILEQVK